MRLNVYSLLVKHQRLDAQLRKEQAQLSSDPARITRLKKLKLAIKDRLQRLSLGRRTQTI